MQHTGAPGLLVALNSPCGIWEVLQGVVFHGADQGPGVCVSCSLHGLQASAW